MNYKKKKKKKIYSVGIDYEGDNSEDFCVVIQGFSVIGALKGRVHKFLELIDESILDTFSPKGLGCHGLLSMALESSKVVPMKTLNFLKH